jgi:TonB family protein
MKPGLRLTDWQDPPNPVAPPTFLIQLDPWTKVFFGNFTDLLWPRHEPPPTFSSAPGRFWNDVFVKSRLPWNSFLDSFIFHSAAMLALWLSAGLLPQTVHLAVPPLFHRSDVVSYELSEYLPPLDTGSSLKRKPQKGNPVHAPQRIISVPANSDNLRQTIVTPPALKLSRDKLLPNIVAWERTAPAIPLAATAARIADLRIPVFSARAVAPPPEVNRARIDSVAVVPNPVIAPAPELTTTITRRNVRIPQPAVVAPPPGVEMPAMRQLTDIRIVHTPVVAPAPQLPVHEQHALFKLANTSMGSSLVAVVPPSPNIQGATTVSGDGRLIALNAHPAPPTAPVEVPKGNRRGTFSASPQGTRGADGTPEVLKDGKRPVGASTESGTNVNGLPGGLFVGSAPGTPITPSNGRNASADDSKVTVTDPPLMASVARRALAVEISPAQQSEAEKQVLGIRKSYSMTLNVPNLNSAGGSLVMHFSELREGEKQGGELFAPVVTRVVAPGYPLELMRENVQGTVELSAVILGDGSVSDVQVLNDTDDRLQSYARDALLHWQFLPALKNGKPVPLQAIVRIPFKPRAIRGF